jgi:hypothetical protein
MKRRVFSEGIRKDVDSPFRLFSALKKSMNENENKQQISQETQDLINSTTPENIRRAEKIEILQKKHAEEKKEIRKEIEQVEDKLIKAGSELEKKEDTISKQERENKALREALLNQKQKISSMIEPVEQLSYGEKVSKMAYDVILKRCRSGYYGGQPCKECKLNSNIVSIK